MLIDRPPLTDGWHLVAMLILGVIVVGIIHRIVKRKLALKRRQELSDEQY